MVPEMVGVDEVAIRATPKSVSTGSTSAASGISVRIGVSPERRMMLAGLTSRWTIWRS